MKRREFLKLGVSSTMATAFASPVTMAAADDLRVIAYDAWLYVLPLLTMASTRALMLAKGARPNVLYARPRLADASSRLVTEPNNDTLYASAWLDLSAGPVTFMLPDFGARYFSLSLMDMYTNNFAVPGTRTTGSKGGTFKVVGPFDAIAASEHNVVRSPTPHVWALARVLVNGPDDLDAAVAAQAGIQLAAPRVEASQQPGVIAAAAPDAPWQTVFAEANRLLAEDRPPITDNAMMQRIAPLGVGPDVDFRPDAFSDAERQEIAAGMEDARALLAHPRARGMAVAGWFYPRANIGVFEQDYLTRAVVARSGLAALPREEAMYMGAAGENGDGLYDGRKPWQLHFASGTLPPVRAFWSLSLYQRTPDGRFFFVENDLRRYAIGDRSPGLRKNADGSLDIWIGHDDPGDERRANWLPAPAGPFTLTLRAYLPDPALLSGKYRLPAVTSAA
jgi:hypothetical protein